jgi:hypothetical protein
VSDEESVTDSEELDNDEAYPKWKFDADQIKPSWHFATREGSKQLTPQPIAEVKAAFAPASKKKVSEVAARTYDLVRRYDADRDDKVAIAESKTVWGALMLQLCVILYKILGQADMNTMILEYSWTSPEAVVHVLRQALVKCANRGLVRQQELSLMLDCLCDPKQFLQYRLRKTSRCGCRQTC